ncbi:MAG: tetratricopeptide repeat protein [Deltaproteobacteria bacterium]|nr:tetratricopeptide repeat protein [Deltaproteobacteria bacterium]MBW2531969.1 tetratricopeptide repeat protein [Deltaproteobacteria bacterium]
MAVETGRARQLAALLTSALLCAGLLGCGAPASSEAYLRSMFAAKRAYNSGRYAEAAHAYERASAHATRLKDRDEARFMQARMLQRLGRHDEAQQRYRQLVERSPSGPRTARAVFEVALIEVEHGDAERGFAMLQAAVESYPDHGSARHGLKLLLAHLSERQGEEAVRDYLRGQLPRFRSTEAEQQAEYEIARSLERSGRTAEARQAYADTAQRHPYPFGNLTDDAWWRASLLDEQLDRPDQAIEDLRRLLEPVEEDITGGRYERPRFPYAQMRIAELYRDRLGDHAAARREFRRVHERHGESVIADDALWQEALLAHRDGLEEPACDAAELLRDAYPASRYVRCLRQLCPSLDEAATEACPGYLLRRFEEGRADPSQEPG